MLLDLAAAVRGLPALPVPTAVSLGLADLRGLFALPAAVHGLPALPLPAAVSLGLADLRGLFTLPAAVRGLPALPAAVSLGLADLAWGTHAGMLNSKSLFLERFGISVLST